ncbi:MAG: purine-nucleoside phosphorylase [Bacteroidota bacterium]|nr:purine-nucleoside phosphorylase [Bacteroidota bacterium]
MLEKFKETAQFIKSKTDIVPEVGIILGSGLGGLADRIENSFTLPYNEIPNFPVSTVEGHSGNMIFGRLGNKNVVAMQGRFHYYEGYDMKAVTFPVRVMHFLGVKYLFVSNASGGLNPDFMTGDIMIIYDHINYFPEHPLRGKNLKELGVRFPDMSKVYDPEMIELAEKISEETGIKLRKGVYIGSTGPTLETSAEYKMFRIFGADATGMSTVPEVIVAHHQGMRVFGLSIVTNGSEPEDPEGETTHEEVQNVAGVAEPKMTKIITELINRI